MKRQLILTARPDQEVDERIKQKYIYLNKCPIFRFENKPCSTFLQGIEKPSSGAKLFSNRLGNQQPKPFFKVIRKSLYFTRFVTQSITVSRCKFIMRFYSKQRRIALLTVKFNRNQGHK